MTTKNYFDFHMEGAKELEKVLKDLPKGVHKNMLKAGLRRAAKPIARDAKQAAPKDTGAAAKSIKVRTMTRTNVPAAISIGPESKYWWLRFHEFGTSVLKARPFLRPAWERNKVAARDSFIKETFNALEMFAARLKKQAYAGKLSKAGKRALGL